MIYSLSRCFFRTVGRTSAGISLCLNEGLTSGKTVDYVYRNKPQGRFLIGKLIDKQFLSHPGWEGVRLRRMNLELLMTQAIAQLRDKKKKIFILDIASGPGAYILSVLEKVGEKDIQTLCRDLEDRWLEEGSLSAESKNLKQVRFEKGDALDAESLFGLTPKPNIVVASGFYDWIPDDEIVKNSFSMVYRTLDEKGYFIMTNQTAHPNLDFVEQVFTDFNHKPLRMKMRSPNIIQEWLEEAGFKVIQTLKDPHEYYSVTLAMKG